MKRVELIYNCDNIEIRYFNNGDERYISWELSKSVISRLIPWWRTVKYNLKEFPIIVSKPFYEFRMDTCKYLYIKEFEGKNRNCRGSYDIPIVVIEALLDMEREGLTEKNI